MRLGIFGPIEVEKDGRLQGDGGLKTPHLQRANAGARLPVHALQRVAGLVVADAPDAGRVLEQALAAGQGAKGRLGGKTQLPQGDDLGVDDHMVVVLTFVLV